MTKQKCAKALIVSVLIISNLMFLPWLYMTPVYYIARYVVMLMTSIALLLTFSFSRGFSVRFVRLMLYTVVCMSVLYLFVPIRLSDITQLATALIVLLIGMGLEWSANEWSEISYYYAVLIVAVTIYNCFFHAGGLYVPEHYMFDEGKNQVGAMVAIGAAACFYFGTKFREMRTAYWVVSFLSLLCLVLIRARADFFALVAVGVLIAAKEVKIQLKWNVKTVLTIIGILLICIIIYSGFVSDEFHRFMVGGKDANNLNDITSDRWARNQEGINVLKHRDTVENFQPDTKKTYIHNYPLLRLVRYGLFSLPLLVFYIYFGISALIEVFKTRNSNVKQAGWIVICVSLLVSFMEPSFPYGPGLVQLLAFLLLGFSLRQEEPLNNEIPKCYVRVYESVKKMIN